MKALLILILLCSVSMAQYGKSVIVGDKGKVLAQDKSTSATIGIIFPHHEIHEGDHYFVCDCACSQPHVN